ncbi:VWA domain-containing protein [Streptacidiphilus sp. P02-A3a]|uniref:VWA domain-containing protein n=1 Tax=Streptacidiphilus sp. P02-A3a TaxID=2704468 RepID=UPI0015F7B9E6|nr:VWA domain-containing protein [Streptacidiphilus sp. P02-A3a]QMU73871.1 VWA domain-containing protein [Streptacidiphilus sp. P02-A3a]
MQIGPGETLDAAAALEALGLDHRERVRAGLAAALLRREGQRAAFDTVFDLYFPLAVGAPEGVRDLPVDAPAAWREQLAGLRDRLADALAADDRAALARLAAEAVSVLGRYGAPGSASDGWSAHQTLDRLQPQILLARVLAAIRAGQGGGGGQAPGQGQGQGGGQGSAGLRRAGEGFTERIEADEIRDRIEQFRRQVGNEARRRVAELRGTDVIARRAVAASPDQVDFLVAGRDQLAQLRRTVQPLSRKLATRLAARRRRAQHGRIDLRRTLRRSLSTGGVPLRPVYRRRNPGRPELVLLCDVSGSVAGFANFTMLLVQALRDQFSKVRVFAFVNRTDEVTDLVTAGRADPAGLGSRILAEAEVTGWDGSSDYGAALGGFADRFLGAVGPRTSVLILGDARTNGRDPNPAALARIAARARRTYWLNPEPRELWSTGDSVAGEYARQVDMLPCRNVRQLGEIVAKLLPV